jgi:DNA-binding beta-propeller fold protein YncE
MQRAMIAPVLLVCIGLLPVGAHATVEWQSIQTIEIGKRLVDVAVTPDGRRTFVLTADGNVLIYSAAGKLEDMLQVGAGFDGISCSADGDRVYLSNRAAGKLQIVEVDFIREINTAGSPFLGPPDAPVTVVVFSDFQ